MEKRFYLENCHFYFTFNEEFDGQSKQKLVKYLNFLFLDKKRKLTVVFK